MGGCEAGVIMSCVGGCWFSPRETKLRSVCDVSLAHSRCPATDKATLTESRWGPSGELNVSCCAKLQKNNSSSRSPSEEDRRQRKAAADVPRRFTIPHYYVENLGRANHHLPLSLSTRRGWVGTAVWHADSVFLCQSRIQFIWLLQLHHKSPSSQKLAPPRWHEVEHTRFWLVGRCHLNMYTWDTSNIVPLWSLPQTTFRKKSWCLG